MLLAMMHRNPTAGLQGKRNGNRLRLGLPAKLVLPHETRECLLDNVSASGARVRLDAPLDKGRTVMLGFHELRVYGTVSWCRNGECGIRFDSKIEQEDMEGFLWITRNPEEYQRICRESGIHDWSIGIGD